MIFLFLVLNVEAAAPHMCGTPPRLADTLSRSIPAPTPPPSPELTDHETHGAITHTQYSDHFALKWGPDLGDIPDTATRLLNDFEFAHSEQVVGWDMNDPTGFGGAYFNVYIGDTGGAVPSVMGNAGYFTLDGEGYPMIVISRDLIEDPPYARSVIAHEFFHAVQYASSAFFYEDTGSWYWEATACWAAGQTATDSDAFFGFLPWYALKPQSGLYHFTYTDFDGAPPDLHQYGAFIFPWYLSEILGASDIILESWRVGVETDDPLRILEELLTEQVVGEAIARHAARNLTWDYPDGGRFSELVEGWSGHFSDHDNRFTELIPHADPDFYTVPEDRWPRAGGTAAMRVPDGAVTSANRLTVLLEYDDSATSGSMPEHVDLHAVVVEYTTDGPIYRPVRTDIPHTNFWLSSGSEVWLTVANTGLLSEAFYPAPFRVSFVPLPDAPEPESEDTGAPTDTENPADTGDHDETPPEETGDTETEPEVLDDYAPPASNEKTGSGCIHTRSNRLPLWLSVCLGLALFRRKQARLQ